MTRKIFGGLTILLIVVGVVSLNPMLKEQVTGWLPSLFASEKLKPVAEHKRKTRPVPVRVAVATKNTVSTYLEGVGTVKARSTVAIKSRIEGQITEALVKEGQTVRKGDVLFRLDARPLKARLREVQAILSRSNASHAKAVADVKRLSNLSSKGYSPQTLVEDAKTQADMLAATVRATAAEVELAQLNLNYATIQSPINGRVGRILITPGNVVKPNDTDPMLIITEIKPVYVSFGIPEQSIDEVRARMAATELLVDVTTQASRTTAATGRLFFINNQVDTATGTIELLAQFDNEDERLIPGQFVRARISLSSIENAVLMHRRAVQINQKGHYLWVVLPNDTVELRAIEIGPESGDNVSITKGLAPGEKVVTDGQLRLFLGAKIQINDGTAATRKDEGKSRKKSQKTQAKP